MHYRRKRNEALLTFRTKRGVGDQTAFYQNCGFSAVDDGNGVPFSPLTAAGTWGRPQMMAGLP
jgi:hypothetical protein